MAVTTASFKIEFPEFTPTPDPTVQAKLNLAVLRTPPGIWAALEDSGVLYLAAHLLTLLPNAREMRIDNGKSPDLYMQERMRLARIVAYGRRVVGSTANIPEG